MSKRIIQIIDEIEDTASLGSGESEGGMGRAGAMVGLLAIVLLLVLGGVGNSNDFTYAPTTISMGNQGTPWYGVLLTLLVVVFMIVFVAMLVFAAVRALSK